MCNTYSWQRRSLFIRDKPIFSPEKMLHMDYDWKGSVAKKISGRDPQEAWRQDELIGGTSAWGYNWATLFLGYINTGTWPSILGESRIWDSKMWSWVSRNLYGRMTALARAHSNYQRQAHPLVRGDVTLGQWSQVFCWKQVIAGRGPQGVWLQDELIGGKPSVVK
jgi:hypothetical protein